MLSALVLGIDPVGNELAALGITTGGQVVIALIVALSGYVIARLERQHKQLTRATQAAESAAEFAAPTGDGFSDHVRDALARIEREQAATRSDVRGLREDDRRLWDYVTNHLPKD